MRRPALPLALALALAASAAAWATGPETAAAPLVAAAASAALVPAATAASSADDSATDATDATDAAADDASAADASAAYDALGSLAGEPAAPPAPAAPVLTRPLRLVPRSAPDWDHHAAPERFSLAMPWGDPQFERFRAAYLTPGGKKWLEAVYGRARPYASFVLSSLRAHGVPEELFFLPFIESEYSPKAVSRSGAAGLWQFMRNSVGGYDMRIDDWVDERRDFMKSTDAALKKLRWNYEHFGDWLLALAAYNCGVGAMDKAIKAAGGERDYWVLRAKGYLKAETASYLPKFLAVVSVAMYAGRNGLDLSWEPSVEWVRLPLDRPVDVAMLASLSGMPLEAVKAGNPELRYAVTPPDGRYAIKVPAEYAEAAKTTLASKDVLMSVYMHVVHSGDTVSELARHYEVSVPMIAKLNPGLNPDRIRLGQVIVIPAFKDKKPYDGGAASAALDFGGRYVIKKGDTLWSLSLQYGVQPEVLAAKNGLTLSSILREGQALAVPILRE